MEYSFTDFGEAVFNVECRVYSVEMRRSKVPLPRLFVGVWGNAPIGFPEGENRHRPGLAGGTGLGYIIKFKICHILLTAIYS